MSTTQPSMRRARVPTPQVRKAHPELNLVTVQAVLAWRDALQVLDGIDREKGNVVSPKQVLAYRSKREAAQWAVREARLGLEQLLKGDA